MTELDLSDNPIGDAGAIALSQSIRKINTLSISGCNITESGVKALTQEIKKRNCSVGFTVVGTVLHNACFSNFFK